MRCALGGQRIRNMAPQRMRAMSGDRAHAIVSITDGGAGATLVTTAAPHGITGTPEVLIAGNSGNYNTNGAVTEVPSTTTFKTDINYDADGYGGTWRLA